MSNVEQPKTEDEDDNVVHIDDYPRSIKPAGGDGNWLKNLSIGTIFIAQQLNDRGYTCSEFEIRNLTDRSALLTHNHDTGFQTFWVIQHLFCKNWNLVEILRIP